MWDTIKSVFAVLGVLFTGVWTIYERYYSKKAKEKKTQSAENELAHQIKIKLQKEKIDAADAGQHIEDMRDAWRKGKL